MARISMRSVQKSTFEQIFSLYLLAAAAKGVKEKNTRHLQATLSCDLKEVGCDNSNRETNI